MSSVFSSSRLKVTPSTFFFFSLFFFFYKRKCCIGKMKCLLLRCVQATLSFILSYPVIFHCLFSRNYCPTIQALSNCLGFVSASDAINRLQVSASRS